MTDDERHLLAWTERFAHVPIPVLRVTSKTLSRLAKDEDSVDAQQLSEVVLRDPLMTLRLLRHAGENRSARTITEVEAVTGVLLHMGISPFFRAFESMDTVEDILAQEPECMEELRTVIRRSRHAALLGIGLAVHRQDPDANVIYQAALLHDFAELLLWAFQPDLAVTIRRSQRHDPDLRSVDAQKASLGFALGELEQSLMKRWSLPGLMVRMTDDEHSNNYQVRTVQVAVRMARHLQSGWSNPAIPDDLEDAADLLNLSVKATQSLIEGISE